MILLYYPLILISILGYGFFTCKKIIGIRTSNLGFLGIVGIFFLLLISYISTQFIAHSIQFNSIVILIGLIFFLIYVKEFNKEISFKLLFGIVFVSFIFLFVGKNQMIFIIIISLYTYFNRIPAPFRFRKFKPWF